MGDPMVGPMSAVPTPTPCSARGRSPDSGRDRRQGGTRSGGGGPTDRSGAITSGPGPGPSLPGPPGAPAPGRAAVRGRRPTGGRLRERGPRGLISGGPGRVGRVRAQVRAAPPRLLDWMSGQVLDHPAVLYDHEGVELLAARQGRSIATAMGALQLALVAAAAASTLEGGPVLALAIDGAIGQVASVVHGFCDWYNTGSYLVRRLAEQGIAGRPVRGAAAHQRRPHVTGEDHRRACPGPGHRAAPDTRVGGTRSGRRPPLRLDSRPRLAAGGGPYRRLGHPGPGHVLARRARVTVADLTTRLT